MKCTGSDTCKSETCPHATAHEPFHNSGLCTGEAYCVAIDEIVKCVEGADCRKCGGEMRPGKAIDQTFTGISDFIGGEVVTVSSGGPGRLINCSKCSVCGWSVK